METETTHSMYSHYQGLTKNLVLSFVVFVFGTVAAAVVSATALAASPWGDVFFLLSFLSFYFSNKYLGARC